jgi:hypothetical protein
MALFRNRFKREREKEREREREREREISSINASHLKYFK